MVKKPTKRQPEERFCVISGLAGGISNTPRRWYTIVDAAANRGKELVEEKKLECDLYIVKVVGVVRRTIPPAKIKMNSIGDLAKVQISDDLKSF